MVGAELSLESMALMNFNILLILYNIIKQTDFLSTLLPASILQAIQTNQSENQTNSTLRRLEANLILTLAINIYMHVRLVHPHKVYS